MFTHLLTPKSGLPYGGDFSGSDGDPPNTEFWTVVAQDVGLGTPYIKSNQLYLYHPSGSSTNPYMRSIPDLTGDFNIQIDFTTGIDPATNSTNWYFGVRETTRHYRIIRKYTSGSYRYEFWDGSFRRAQIFRQDSVGKLMLYRTSNIIKSKIWDSGGTEDWIDLYSGSSATTSLDLYIYLSLNNSTGTTSYPECSINYDNFIINSGTLVWP